jgi:prepilin-type N-terminal cleavage/methylation domain-containing protein
MKRRGFTLIELMVVIAIIIILAAIAIPNYLKMTERAKKSRLQSDFATLATCLETFRTDWGSYPVAAAAQAVNTITNNIYIELAGTGQAAAANKFNTWGSTNAVGETNPGSGACIEYLKAGTLSSMVNPFSATAGDAIQYGSSNGGHWIVYVNTKLAGTPYMSRSDTSSTPAYSASVPAIP